MDGNELQQVVNDLRWSSALDICANLQLAASAAELLDLCDPSRFLEHHRRVCDLHPGPEPARARHSLVSSQIIASKTKANRCRYFPYFITVASLSILFIVGIFWLISQRRLLPAIVMVGGFMFFVLWLTGLVVVAMQLFGPDGSIQSVCDVQVFGRNPKGTSVATMAWLQQRNICTFLFDYL